MTTRVTPESAACFILDNTALMSPPHVPEVVLHLADEAFALWSRTEDELEAIGLPPPYWAFAWAGGQGLARYVLDNPGLVRGRRVFDFASGSGLVGIAALKAGAAAVTCADIDAFAAVAIGLNAAANGVEPVCRSGDPVGGELDCDVLLAGDIFYEKQLADRLVPWFAALAAKGVEVVVGDPGRAYLPRQRLAALATYQVPVTRSLEDAEVKKTTVWRFA